MKFDVRRLVFPLMYPKFEKWMRLDNLVNLYVIRSQFRFGSEKN